MHTTLAQKRAIEQYYKELAAYQQKNVTHETAVRTAFQNVLTIFAQSVNWLLIPEQPIANGKRPDGTLRDNFNLPRGYWEAKDTKDDLATEIRKKISAGYPLVNTIFEDTRRAVLYQNNKAVFEANLSNPKELMQVLDSFFHYIAPDFENFERAVEEFRESIPDLAQGLVQVIEEEHRKNTPFKTAFATFLELCRQSLDPNMTPATVDEMLVQHLLTERLFRTIFDNPDFVTRNIIASEIEKVIQALTIRSFNRREFLKSLDRFYRAIEDAARNLDDWKEKQSFLNIVYERFFQSFSKKQADTHGIVYTPQEIVDFMCASVDVILQREFSSTLSTPGVQILDPAVGTGNFIVSLIQRINGGTLASKYANDLFCNEIMLLPYYIASLNIEHAYYARTGQYKPFEGIAFADTLDLAEGRQLSLFVERNTERIEREKNAQIMVVIGNPPYNVGQKSENDNNKNRKYPIIDERIRETYAKDSKATLNSTLYDAYVRFFRWAIDRLQGRDGIVCFVTNNSFVDQFSFDGMRKNLLQDFNEIYHIDLHGNVRKNPKLSGTSHNVFGIQVGVGITIAVRKSSKIVRKLYYYRVPEYARKEEKLRFLAEVGNISNIEWKELEADSKHNWLTENLHPEFGTFLPIGTKDAKLSRAVDVFTFFRTYSTGVLSGRDSIVYNFDRGSLLNNIMGFLDEYNAELARWLRAGSPKDIDNFVKYDKIKWSRNLKRDLQNKRQIKLEEKSVRIALYRPFTKRWLYYADIIVDELGKHNSIFPTSFTETENRVICLTGSGSEKPFMTLITNTIPDLHLVGPGCSTQCFPYYTYAEDGSNRRENITDWALQQFQQRYGAGVAKRDIFQYVYAMLHHPLYRERYAENLKRDLPHIPLLTTGEQFASCVRVGKRLMELHLGYEEAEEYPLMWVENKDMQITWRVEKMKLSAGKEALQINEWLRLEGIPQDCYRYRLGNRSALEWVIDQYQMSEDKRSGIMSDPNREDDEQYIVRLVGRVITVSMETVQLVDELSQMVQPDAWIEQAEA